MRAFVDLLERLDRSAGTGAKVAALADHFAMASPADAAWALHCLLGRQRRRLISGRRLRQICQEASALPAWLFDDCHAHVGDSAETIALLWRPAMTEGEAAGPPPAEAPLQEWMEQLLPRLAALEGEEQAMAVRALWNRLPGATLLVANKLLTGGFRVGVARGLVLRALARHSGLEEPLLAHRLMGGFQPGAAAWRALLAPPGEAGGDPGRPYPFFLASPLQAPPAGAPPLPGAAGDWLVEWKWDGIRAQMIRRAGHSFLWSRGEELLNPAFPELVALADALPDGTVLDGEVLVWPPDADRPAPFARLQRRLGRRAPSRRLLAECPAAYVAYDLLEAGLQDLRAEALRRRRGLLEEVPRQLAGSSPEVGALRLSEPLVLPGWEDLEPLRRRARAAGAEGLMLKQLTSPYRSGRRRGSWWKHKLDPFHLDAVLLYAQAGSGRRANLFTDYTFGLWSRPPAELGAAAAPAGAEPPRLVTFAKAYSGLKDAEITELDRWIRRHTVERFGPVRAVEPQQVFELAFEGLQPSRRHRSGIAVRFPRIARWRRDKPAAEADCLAAARALMEAPA